MSGSVLFSLTGNGTALQSIGMDMCVHVCACACACVLCMSVCVCVCVCTCVCVSSFRVGAEGTH